MRRLVVSLSPLIRTAVVSVLERSRRGQGRRVPQQEVEDVTQSVLLSLFADRGALLLQWDPARNLTLEQFVSLVAKRETISILRSRRRRHEEPDEEAVAPAGPEAQVISREMIANLIAAVRSRLSPKDAELFELLFVRGLSLEEVAGVTGMPEDAVYAARGRVSHLVKEVLVSLREQEQKEKPGQTSRERH
jgi:RNA polymerase sigma-70 factor (ECF subfamily)